jgi:hypothetical protein
MLSKEDFDTVFHSTSFSPPNFETVATFADQFRAAWIEDKGTPDACFPAFGLGLSGVEGAGVPDDSQTIAKEFGDPNSNPNTMVDIHARLFKNSVDVADFLKALESRTSGCSGFQITGSTTNSKTFTASDSSDYGVAGTHWSITNVTLNSQSDVFIMSHGNIVLFFNAEGVVGAKFPVEDMKSLLSLQQARLQKAG